MPRQRLLVRHARRSCRRDAPIRTLAHVPAEHRRIENQHDAAVAEIGGAGDARRRAPADRRSARTTISRWPTMRSTASPTRGARRCRPRTRAARPRRRVRQPEQPSEPHDRQRRAAVRRHLVALDAAATRRSTSMTSRTAACGTANVSLADRRDQRVGDRQRQRQLESEPRAGARRRLERQRAAELLDRGPDDAHADAAPARAVRLVARREARRAEQRAAASLRRAARPAPAGPRPRARARPPRRPRPARRRAISSRPMSPARRGAEHDACLRRLAGGDALLRRSRCRG